MRVCGQVVAVEEDALGGAAAEERGGERVGRERGLRGRALRGAVHASGPQERPNGPGMGQRDRSQPSEYHQHCIARLVLSVIIDERRSYRPDVYGLMEE